MNRKLIWGMVVLASWLAHANTALATGNPSETTFAERSIIGLQLGIPQGFGIYALTSLNNRFAVGPTASRFSVSMLGERTSLSQIGALARYHWAGLSPRGGYFFGSLTYIRVDFGDSFTPAPVIKEEDSVLHPMAGIGYQTLMRDSYLSLDFGLGVGPRQTLERQTTLQHGKVTVGGTIYVGAGLNFR